MGIDDVKKALEANTVLTDDVKTNLFELILLFEKNYPDISLEVLAKRLETVQIEVVTKFVSNKVVLYNSKTNCIQINKTELQKSNNIKYSLMVGIVHMLIPDDKDPKGLLEALTEGYAKLVANNLVGSEE